jgi:hypothetical protein
MTDLEIDLSDTATEVISYTTTGGTNSRPHSKSSNRPSSTAVIATTTTQTRQTNSSFDQSDSQTIMPSPRPGGQRAILEIASQMGPDDISEVIELLNLLKSQGMAQQIPIPSPYSNYSSNFPTPQGYNYTPSITSPYSTNYAAPTSSNSYTASHKHTTGYPPTPNQHIPSPQGRKGKSGQTMNHIISEEDEEVTQHTNHNETYRLIPPAAPINAQPGVMSSSMSTLIHTSHNGGAYSTTPSTLPGSHSTSKYNYRSNSATSNASGTNSACNSRSSTPIHKKSPVPITNQHDICPTVQRELNPNFSHRATDSTPTPPRPIAITEVPPLVLPRTERVNTSAKNPSTNTSSSKNASSSSKQEKNGRNALLDSLHSPRSAFDDCSLSSSSSNFTSASNRSGRSRGSSTVTGHASTNSRHK